MSIDNFFNRLANQIQIGPEAVRCPNGTPNCFMYVEEDGHRYGICLIAQSYSPWLFDNKGKRIQYLRDKGCNNAGEVGRLFDNLSCKYATGERVKIS